MSTTASAGVICPSSSPVKALPLAEDSVGLAVEFVTSADDLFGSRVLVDVSVLVVVDLTVLVVVDLNVLVVDVTGVETVVLALVVVVTSSTLFARGRPPGVVFVLVSVKTRTSRSRGLDHISR
jgi:hypothetical protein